MVDCIIEDSLLDQQLISALINDKPGEKKLELIKELLGDGANVNAEDSSKRTPLHWASKLGYEQIVNVLLENKDIIVNAIDNDGNTPLHLAAECNGEDPLNITATEAFFNIVKALISCEATNLPNINGRTPSKIALLKKYGRIYEYIELSNDPTCKPGAIAEKREGACGAGGYTYKHSVLMFLLVEGKRRNSTFLLGTKLPKAGVFSDAVFKYSYITPEGHAASQIFFFAVKFKENPESKRKTTYEELFSDSNTSVFLFRKYFEHYRQIRKHFHNDDDDPIFSKCHFKNCQFIFFTNAIFDFSADEKEMLKYKTNSESILYLGDNYDNEYYQFKFVEKRDEIIDFLGYSSDCKKLAKNLAESFDRVLNIDIGVGRDYHASLAAKVIEKNGKEAFLRSSFVDDDDCPLQQEFFKELKKLQTFHDMSIESIKAKVKTMNMKVHNKFGNIKGKELIRPLPTDVVLEGEIQDFVAKLKIYHGQPAENDMTDINKDKLQYYLSTNDIDDTFNFTRLKVETWWKTINKDDEPNFLTEEFIFTLPFGNTPFYFDIQFPVTSFVGREEDLKEILEEFENCTENLMKTTVISHQSNDVGGMGKSELVKKYIQQHGSCYEALLWINAASVTTLTESFHNLAEKKMIKTRNNDGSTKDLNDIVSDIFALFQSKKSLFVYDNAENGKYFSKILSFGKHSTGNISHNLITSRYQEWSDVSKVLLIEPLKDHEAINFLKEELKGEKMECLEHLIENIGHCPGDLKLAVDFIKDQRIMGDFEINDYNPSEALQWRSREE